MPFLRRTKRCSVSSPVKDRSLSASRAEIDKTRITMNDLLSLPFKCVGVKSEEMDIVEEGTLLAGTKNYYEAEGYENVLTRMDRGHQLVKLLESLIEDRRRLEDKHASDLFAFASKWNKAIDVCCEYGTTKKIWRAAIQSTDVEASVHQSHSSKLKNILKTITEHKKVVASKGFGDPRRRSELHLQYKKRYEAVQRGWIKLLGRVEQSRKEYDRFVGIYKHAKRLSNATESDFGATEAQKQHCSQNLGTTKQQMEYARERYQKNVDDTEKARQNYIAEMDHLFNDCQNIESERMTFVKDVFKMFAFAKKEKNSETAKTATKLLEDAIAQQDITADLNWYASNFVTGTVSHANWPEFDERYQ